MSNDSSLHVRTRRLVPTVARFLLDGPVLPLVTETLRVAEAFRAAAMSRFERWCQRGRIEHFRRSDEPDRYSSPTLSGRDSAGQRLLSHGHAWYLPTAENDAGRLDHVTVYAEDGLGEEEVAALDGLGELRLGRDTEPLCVRLVGLGRPQDFRCSLLDEACIWESATPFVVNRHYKARGQKKDPPECRGIGGRPLFARRVLEEELGRLAARSPQVADAIRAGVEVCQVQRLGRAVKFRPLEFRRARQRPGDEGLRRPAAGFRINFARAVGGPICLGHAAHFGLGLFLPCYEGPQPTIVVCGGGA